MKKKKYLDLYYRWMERGQIPYRETKRTSGGLCSIFPDNQLLELLLPDNGCSYYCGLTDDDWYNGTDSEVGFTTLRQNIVLLMAAMNNEL